MASAFYIMREAISRERLQELRVRVVAETALGDENDPIDEPLLCFSITNGGLKKLGEYGYDINNIVDTDLEGIKFVALANPDGSPASVDVDPATIRLFTWGRWNGNGSDTFKRFIKEKAMEILVPAFDRHIQVLDGVSHETPPQPADSSTLSVVFRGSDISGETYHPETMWGISNPNHEMSYIGLFMDGTPIICTEGEEVAAFNDTNLYIYSGLHVHDCDNSRDIIVKIFEEAARLRSQGASVEDEEKVKKLYVKACGKRAEKRKKQLENDLARFKLEVEAAQAKLSENLREYTRARHESDNFDQFVQELDTKLGNEYDGLLRVPAVEGVGWRGDKLIVDTDTLYCIDPRSGHEHEIGKFRLIVDNRTTRVLFINKTRRVQSFDNREMNGPHLFPDGSPCLGTLQETIPQLMGAYEWSALIQICIGFIQTVNVDDSAGRGIHKWPVSRTKEQIAAGAPRPNEAVETPEAVEEEAQADPNDVPQQAVEDAAEVAEEMAEAAGDVAMEAAEAR